MLIAVNAGNSRVLLGGYEEDERIFAASIATEPRQMPEDYACRLQQVLGLYGVCLLYTSRRSADSGNTATERPNPPASQQKTAPLTPNGQQTVKRRGSA